MFPVLLSTYALASRSLQGAGNDMSVETFRDRQRRDTFRDTLRLEVADLQRRWRQPIESFRVALKRHHVVAGWIAAKYLEDHHLKFNWSVNGGTAMKRQVLKVHPGAVLSLRCPECKEFRRRLFFTTHDNCRFDNNWFHCERCVDQRLEPRNGDRRPKTQGGTRRDRRAKHTHHGSL